LGNLLELFEIQKNLLNSQKKELLWNTHRWSTLW
jgi:hypothetical protein